MSEISSRTPPVAGYVTLTPGGDALHCLLTYGEVSVEDAQTLTKVGWAEPMIVRTTDKLGESIEFEVIELTVEGGIVHGQMTEVLQLGKQPWGRMIDLKTQGELVYGFQHEAVKVYRTSTIKKSFVEEARSLFEKSAKSWHDMEIGALEVEECVLRKWPY